MDTDRVRDDSNVDMDGSRERRRALILGLASLPALMTITSRPLWAASGNLSGGSSNPAAGTNQNGPTTLQQLHQGS